MSNDSDSLDVYSVVDLNIHKIILYSSDKIKVNTIKTIQFCVYTNNDYNDNYNEQYSSNIHDYNTIKHQINEKVKIICCLDWYIQIKIIVNFNNYNSINGNDIIHISNESLILTSDRIIIRNTNRNIIPLLSINKKPIGKIIVSIEFQYNYNSFKYLILSYQRNEKLPYILINDILSCIKDHCSHNSNSITDSCYSSSNIVIEDDECDDIRYDRNECIIDSNQRKSFINNHHYYHNDDDDINDDATSSITTIININNEIPYDDDYHLIKNNSISNMNNSMINRYSYDKNILHLTTAIDEFTILLTDYILFDQLLFKSLNTLSINHEKNNNLNNYNHYNYISSNDSYDNSNNISMNNNHLSYTTNKISSNSSSSSMIMKYFPYHKVVLGVRNIINNLIGHIIQV